MKIVVLSLIALSVGAQAQSPLRRVPSGLADLENPYRGDERAQRAGKKLYGRECASCHGTDGAGTRKAPSLRNKEVLTAKPAELLWVLRNGSLRRGMPSFAHLPEARRWQIITYIQSLDQNILILPRD
jgi:mono/diheme cytochrome c family protein